ncbi:MAG: hypothetical protein V3U96_12730, partial [Paracoccaceae bacterium]
LEHLVARTVNRTDASKFIYILNQIDTAAKDDNTEEIVAAWQRAIAQAGLSAGKFFTIYDETAAVPIEDISLRERFRTKRDHDLDQIIQRMDGVELQRNYRIVSMLETVASELENDILPNLRDARARWRRLVLLGDALVGAAILAVGVALCQYFGWSLPSTMQTTNWIKANPIDAAVAALAGVVLILALHYWIRGLAAKRIAAGLSNSYGQLDLKLRQAFLKNTGLFQSIFRVEPTGWGKRAAKNLRQIRETVAGHIQNLNDRYADPSGKTPNQSPVNAP